LERYNIEFYGTILNSVDKTIKWAETMTWKGLHPVVHLRDKVYEKRSEADKKGNEGLRREVNEIRNLA